MSISVIDPTGIFYIHRFGWILLEEQKKNKCTDSSFCIKQTQVVANCINNDICRGKYLTIFRRAVAFLAHKLFWYLNDSSDKSD